MPYPDDGGRDRPWIMRTYAGHSSPSESNALYRRNLAKGQTGLSVAFDLPTQTGYDPDAELARGEVGKVGVPVAHIGDVRALFDGIPLDHMNTSMTINAPAMWLFALYLAVAEEQGGDLAKLAGTTQNDIVKEYLSRGTYVFPPGPSMRLITDMISYAVANVPKWNPINVCSYHLQEAGATPVQEVAFAMCTAIAVLDSVRDSGQVPAEKFGEVVARISFFVNAGVRFVEEMCKLRAFARLWDDVTRERYGVTDAKARRFRYGVQVNSLGLTEAQPENNVYRILLEMLAVTMSRDARARGGAVAAVESGYLKSALVSSLAQRRRRIEAGEDVVVGVNRFTESEPNPLLDDIDLAIQSVDPAAEAAAIHAVQTWRATRDQAVADEALTALRDAAKTDTNLMEASLRCARAGVTTGEWAGVLREVFGEYRPPTGVGGASGGGHEGELSGVRERVRAVGESLGRPLRFLVGKPGLDGHSNGAEQIAVRARDAGFEVIYSGIRLTPAQIVAAAVEEDVDVVGLSVLSGSHLSVVPEVVDGLRAAGLDDVPVVVGGIVPDADAERLRAAGVARVFTPKDFEITDVLDQVVDAIVDARG